MRYSFTIDTEEEWDWDAEFPVHNYSVENILRLHRFTNLCERYGAKTTYFVNHAVLEERTSCEQIECLSERKGVEIGMHVHPWTNPPLTELDNTTQTSFLENLPASQGFEKLSRTYELHRDRGFSPCSYRGGRYSSGETTQAFLAQHGFRVDASVCPFSFWPDEGAPDYGTRGLEPRRIADTARSGDSTPGLWSLPLTRLYSQRPFQFWNNVYRTIETTPLSKLRLIGVLERLRVVQKIWLNFETENCDAMLWVIRNAHRLDLPYLCFTVHSSSLSVGPSPYARTSQQVDRIFDGIERVLKCLSDDLRFQPATMAEIACEWEQKAITGIPPA